LKDAQQQVFLEFQYFLLMLIIRNKRLTTKNYFRMRIRNWNSKIFHFAVNNSQIGTECGNQTETDQVSVLLSTQNVSFLSLFYFQHQKFLFYLCFTFNTKCFFFISVLIWTPNVSFLSLFYFQHRMFLFYLCFTFNTKCFFFILFLILSS
jgi:hypothetical protein